MKLSRRLFFKKAAITAAVAPVAAQQQMTGIGTLLPPAPYAGGLKGNTIEPSFSDLAGQLIALQSGKRDEEMWRQASYVHAFDADLTTSRSLSLSTKVRIQRERNFERCKAAEEHWILQGLKRIQSMG